MWQIFIYDKYNDFLTVPEKMTSMKYQGMQRDECSQVFWTWECLEVPLRPLKHSRPTKNKNTLIALTQLAMVFNIGIRFTQ